MEHWRNWDSRALEHNGSYFLLGFILFVFALERIYPYRSDMRIFRRGFWLDLLWYTLIQSYFLKLLIFDGIILPLKVKVGLSDFGMISHWPLMGLLVFFLFTHDLYIYWFHRWQHNSKILWKTHEAHHSVKDVDWLAGSRSHPLEILINQTIEFLPIFFLLDGRTAAIIVPLKALLDAIWGIWIHANVKLRLGKLIYFFNGPEMHQWHHGNHKEVFYANYATKFSIFDWLFGTAFLPGHKPLHWKVTKPLGFGLPYPFPETYLGQIIYSMVRLDFNWMNSLNFANLLRRICAFGILRTVFLQIQSKWNMWFSDQENPQYEMDRQERICPNCFNRMKYFYEADCLNWQCSHCEKDLSATFEKFGRD